MSRSGILQALGANSVNNDIIIIIIVVIIIIMIIKILKNKNIIIW